MKIIRAKDYRELSSRAARAIADAVRAKPEAALCLAAGATPQGAYRELAGLAHKGGLDFSRVAAFCLDEYYGIAPSAGLPYGRDISFRRFLWEELYRHTAIKEENIFAPDARMTDTRLLCAEYEEKLRSFGGVDFTLLGIGANGHIGFNEPGSSASSRTRLIELAPQTIDDNYEKFGKKAGLRRDEMPRSAVTMGIATILESRAIMLIASGRDKAAIIARAFEGPVDERVPASLLRTKKENMVVLVDAEAAAGLKEKREK